jgi:hypothetical protein
MRIVFDPYWNTNNIPMAKMLRSVFTILSIYFAVAVPGQMYVNAATSWEPVGVGIDYTLFRLSDPNNIHVARMDRSLQNAIIESSIAQGRTAQGFETVSGMFERYDQSINYWGQSWGSRNNVVVAINGSFYNTQTGVPRGGIIHSGWYAKRFDNVTGESGFAWSLNRDAFIGRCVAHPGHKQLVHIIDSGTSITFDGVNVERGVDQLILYTPQYDVHTGTDNSGLEILVEMNRPTILIPTPNMAKGTVREVRQGLGSTPLPFDHIVLSVHGSAMTDLSSLIPGDEIGISQELTHFEHGCDPPTWLDWTKTYASISGSFNYLRDGVIYDYSHDLGALERHPRTAIAFNDEYMFFIVVDGRYPGVSIGMTIAELAEFTKNTLGATWAIAQDGGGSSTMVINGDVVNIPNADLLANRVYLPLVSSNLPDSQGLSSSMNLEVESFPSDLQSFGIERYVANGMMMVVIEDIEKSSSYSPSNAIITLRPTKIRLGPGSNYPSITTIGENTLGIILDHLNNLEGVLAKGDYWWKVSLAGFEGWVPESSISLVEN